MNLDAHIEGMRDPDHPFNEKDRCEQCDEETSPKLLKLKDGKYKCTRCRKGKP